MTENSNAIVILPEPRAVVEVILDDGRVLSGKRGTPLEGFLKALPEWSSRDFMGAVVNGELRELTYPIKTESHVRPLTMRDTDGSRIYRRSVTFLLAAAFDDLFSGADLAVDHSLSSGAFYCEVVGRAPLSREEILRLEAHMRRLVQQNLPFERQTVPLEEAIKIFEKKGQDEKVLLLKYRKKGHLVLYRLGRHQDYHHGYMVPSTGYLRWFALEPAGDGFALRFPRRHAPNRIQPLPDSKILLNTFRQYGSWLARLGIESVGALNAAVEAGRIREIILVSEALHELRIAEVARKIVESSQKARIVLIAGPSSSGKTTFSKRLSIQLLAQGLSPFPLEMDNYFVDREHTPKDANGQYDFESLQALDTDRLGSDLAKLIAGQEVQLPRFNFKSGQSQPGEVVRLQKEQLVILEGIHGLNPNLLPGFPVEQTYRVYVSCLTQLNLDRHNRISTTDTRLLRRIIRDARERGYSAQQTISRWESVTRGEKQHIFPYQENANDLFNSALVYDVPAMRSLAEPLLRQVPFGCPEHIEAKRLLTFLEWFMPIEGELIPDNSILREFIGRSILKEFKLWEEHTNGNGI